MSRNIKKSLDIDTASFFHYNIVKLTSANHERQKINKKNSLTYLKI